MLERIQGPRSSGKGVCVRLGGMRSWRRWWLVMCQPRPPMEELQQSILQYLHNPTWNS